MNTDLNLLFGVLALQADMIDSAQFAEACTAWAARKSRPLAELLVERGWLTPADRADVERLVERKLKRHCGDVLASLGDAANDQARRALAALNDPEIDRSLGDLPRQDGFISLSTVSSQPETRERYSLMRLHARGGIGQVWLARDGELGRHVALKELRPERAESPASWARFIKEARITGQLEHPGIVPVYELARRALDEQPFYTMRFVAGHTLSEAIKAYHQKRELGRTGPREQQELLSALVGACNAVAYAHSRGVIHRDLKPDNIALGDYGEVIVLDWGLAKLVDGPNDESAAPPVELEGETGKTMPGQAMGTPRYMAPEQAAGRVDLIERRSDVYGLGAVLYEILTGRPPFSGSDSLEVMRKVQSEEPQRPRDLCREVPAALEAVCLRALAKRPAARYASAKELAEELKRWLAGDPVEAWREPWLTRAQRWIGRHRTLMTTAAAFVLTAVVTLAISSVRLARERDRTEGARRDAVKNLGEARRQQERAEASLAKVRGAIDHHWVTQRVDNYEEWQLNHRDDEFTFKHVWDDSLAFVESTIDTQGSDPLTALYNARSCASLGVIHYARRRMVEAQHRFRQAAVAYEKLMVDYPNMTNYRPRLAGVYYHLGNALKDNGQSDEAFDAFSKSIELDPASALAHTGLAATLTQKAQYDRAIGVLRRALELNPKYSIAHNDLGMALKRKGLYDQAIPEFQKAIELEPKNAVPRGNLGAALNDKRQYDQAIPEFRKAIELDPKNPATHNNLGIALSDTGRYDQAIPEYQKAIELDPKNALAHSNLGLTLNKQGLYDAAIPVLRKAIELDPKNASAHNNLGLALNGKRQYDQAIPFLRKAVELDPKLAVAHNNLGLALNGKGLYDQAILALRKAIELDPKLAAAHNNLGLALNGKGEYDQAIPVLRKAVELDPKLAVAYSNLGLALSWEGQYDEAISVLRKAIELDPKLALAYSNLGWALNEKRQCDQAIPVLRKAIELDPKLAIAYSNLGRALNEKRQYDEAIPILHKAIELDPKNAITHGNLGVALNSTTQYDEAISVLRKAIELDSKSSVNHNNLGFALNGKEEYDEAIPFLRKAIELDPKLGAPYRNLGIAFNGKRRYDQAILVLRKAIELDSKDASVHNNLGLALNETGQYDRAISILRKATELDPNLAAAYSNLGRAHYEKGQFDEAIPILQRAIELDPVASFAQTYLGGALLASGRFAEALASARRYDRSLPPNNPERREREQLVHRLEQMVDLEEKLPAILRGDIKLFADDELTAFPELCQYKKHWLTSARFWQEAFAAKPQLAADLNAGHRYNAACAAARAATGRGGDAAKLGDEQRTRWRQQSREWLRADLEAWTSRLKTGSTAERVAIQQQLSHWKVDPDLASIRDDGELTKLSEPERTAWRALWTDVAGLLARTRDQK